MKSLVFAAAAVLTLATPAFADTPLTDEETTKAVAAASAWGCEGGKWEKETEATGVYELDDAKCKDGNNYDLKFNSDFKLLIISAD
jgi:hypothetical protein